MCRVLLRLVLHDLGRTLTDGEANELRDKVYAALHQGAVHRAATRRVQRRQGARAARRRGAPLARQRESSPLAAIDTIGP
jgi:hypothetical protein